MPSLPPRLRRTPMVALLAACRRGAVLALGAGAAGSAPRVGRRHAGHHRSGAGRPGADRDPGQRHRRLGIRHHHPRPGGWADRAGAGRGRPAGEEGPAAVRPGQPLQPRPAGAVRGEPDQGPRAADPLHRRPAALPAAAAGESVASQQRFEQAQSDAASAAAQVKARRGPGRAGQASMSASPPSPPRSTASWAPSRCGPAISSARRKTPPSPR